MENKKHIKNLQEFIEYLSPIKSEKQKTDDKACLKEFDEFDEIEKDVKKMKERKKYLR